MGKHYVPQEYLRAFSPSLNRSDIWMFDKVELKWSHPAIKRVAQTRDYYSSEDERRLAKEVEAGGHEALGVLRKGGTVSQDQRDALAYYLAVFVMRGPRKRRKAGEVLPASLERTISDVRSGLAELRTDANAARVDALLEEAARIEKQYRSDPPSTVVEQLRSPWPSAEVVALVKGMVWRVVKNPEGGRRFFTSDSPAYYFDSLGLGRDNSELTFPVSPDLAILGSHQGDRGSTHYVQALPKLVKEVNSRTSWGAERFLFADQKRVWIDYLATRRRARLNRIEW